MRDIEFRGKRKDKSGWVHGDLNQKDIHHGTSILENGCINNAVIPETVGQWTGLKDKNGVKIFEGDIIKIDFDDDTETSQIAWFGDAAKFVLQPSNIAWTTCFDEWDVTEEAEVIGNIHDNAELINPKKEERR